MCGIVGVISSHKSSAYEVYKGLLKLQHRGQDAAGIMTYDLDKKKFNCKKDLGLVSQVFSDEKSLERLSGQIAIGSNRYATVGSDDVSNLQPLLHGHPLGVGMVHNGNLVNYYSLIEHLKNKYKWHMLTSNDVEIFLNLWGDKIYNEEGSLFEGICNSTSEIFKKVNGGYSVLGVMADEGLFAFRDPKGIRPLVLGEKNGSYCLSSEVVALNFLDYKYIRDIKPGEVIFINKNLEIQSRQLTNQRPSHCMFEWVYFSAAESAIEKKSVYSVRLNLGRFLAKRVKSAIDLGEISPDIVCPVPDTSRTASISLAETLNLPYREGLIKNRYIHRSFILKNQADREKAVSLKLTPVHSEVYGKNILLVDDSIVRGTTSRRIIELLKKYGAKEITLAITCSAFRYSCYYGIDFPDHKQLIAKDKSVQEIAEWTGANKIIYLEENDMKEAIGIGDLCMACLNGKYPTDIKVEGENFNRYRGYER